MEKENTVSRRAVICGALATATLGFIPEVAEAAGGITQLKNGKLQISIAKNPILNKVGGAIQIPLTNGNTVAVVRTAAGAGTKAFSALLLACTHQGATVVEQGSLWVCPLHGSQFKLNGQVVQGPANRNLLKIPMAVQKNNIVLG